MDVYYIVLTVAYYYAYSQLVPLHSLQNDFIATQSYSPV